MLIIFINIFCQFSTYFEKKLNVKNNNYCNKFIILNKINSESYKNMKYYFDIVLMGR